jgi:asparagine synthase (glutamine-hydrolysing)
MCGIAGIFSSTKLIDPSLIATMTRILRHRGPDDEGYCAVNVREKSARPLVGKESAVSGRPISEFTEGANLFFGHRRLSILDVSPAGHQPMCDKDENVWIVFNGEIYNYIELKEDLAKKGYAFRTATDTEVLLYAYLEWGTDCLAKFNGMWAFVLYDRRKNIMWGSRDRFGVKPLYYYSKNGWFCFASEIKALVSLPFVDKQINEAAAFDYLSLNINNPENCFFEGIEELKPSEAFSVDLAGNEVKKWTYYRLETTTGWAPFDEKRFLSINERMRGLVSNAVRLRLRSDVAVGSCLSGGMDSSAIVCSVNGLLEKESIGSVGTRQKVFTACYSGESIDESKWAKMVVDATGAEWHRTFPAARTFLEDMDDLVYCQEIPFVSSSIYAQYCVMKLAREKGVKVLLDGQGGDELFTGYEQYYNNFYLELLRRGQVGTLVREIRFRRNAQGRKHYFGSVLKTCAKRVAYDMVPEALLRGYRLLSRPVSRYLSRDFVATNASRGRERLKTAFAPVNGLLAAMMRYNLSELLRYEDRNSMRFSIESRTPFADDIDLINYTFSLPSVYKIHNGWNKFLLRQAVTGIVPEAILRRTDKIGFDTPEYSWLAELKDGLLPLMHSDGLDRFIDLKKMAKDWNTLFHNQKRAGITAIWPYINFALWKKRFSL